MSSGGLASHYSSPEAIPTADLFSLVQVVYAAGCVNFFFFAFLLVHARTYFLDEGWKHDNWFFRAIVSNLVFLSCCSIGLSSAAAHWVLESLYRGTYLADQLDWIDVVQRLLCFPCGFLANAFFTYRTFQISDSRAVWIVCLLLWIPPGFGFLLAEVFHIWTLADFRWGLAWRICELVGTGGLFALEVFYFVVLSYRLYICRRRQIKPTEDPVSQYFLGTLRVSFLTCAVTIGNLVTVAMSLDSTRSSIYYSFFLLILPNCWATSVVWAINQRVTIRQKMRSTISDDASLAKRLEVVGWRTTVPTVEGCFDVHGSLDRGDPGHWRGDDATELEDRSSYRRPWRTGPTEPEYDSFELDTSPLDALEPVGVRETRASGVWVKTETRIESTLAGK